MARRLFLERRTYRQTRLQDAARLLPVLGVILIFGPIFIRDDAAVDGADAVAATAPSVAGGLVYYFAVWLGLIALTALVSRAMRDDPILRAEQGGTRQGAGEVGSADDAPPSDGREGR